MFETFLSYVMFKSSKKPNGNVVPKPTPELVLPTVEKPLKPQPQSELQSKAPSKSTKLPSIAKGGNEEGKARPAYLLHRDLVIGRGSYGQGKTFAAPMTRSIVVFYAQCDPTTTKSRRRS